MEKRGDKIFRVKEYQESEMSESQLRNGAETLARSIVSLETQVAKDRDDLAMMVGVLGDNPGLSQEVLAVNANQSNG